MSADNVIVCPNCEVEETDEIKKVKEEVLENADKGFEYYRSLIKLSDLKEEQLGATLEERWELTMLADKHFLMEYSCYCPVCGWLYERKIEEKVN